MGVNPLLPSRKFSICSSSGKAMRPISLMVAFCFFSLALVSGFSFTNPNFKLVSSATIGHHKNPIFGVGKLGIRHHSLSQKALFRACPLGLKMQAKTANEGDIVGVRYQGTLEDGSVFDENPEGPLLEFELGSGRVIKGFERAVRGLGIGESREVKCGPDEAYGDYSEDNIATIPRDDMPDPPEGQELEAGLMIQLGNGQVAVVKKVSPEGVVLDANHPLAGKTLNFKVWVHEIKEAEEAARERRELLRQLVGSPLIRALAPDLTKDPAYVDKTLALLDAPSFNKAVLTQIERSPEWYAISAALLSNPQLQELLDHPERVADAGLKMVPVEGPAGAHDLVASSAIDADFSEDA